MKRSWMRLWPLFLALLLAAGCTANLRLGGISIAVTDFRPVDATLLETRARMTLRFASENVFPIAVSGATHKLYLNGTYVGKAVTDEPVGLPALNTATQTVTLYLENLALIQKLQAMARTESPIIRYRLESKLIVVAGEDQNSHTTSSSGELDIGAFLPAR